MAYTIDDYIFWISVGVAVGLILYVISKGIDWAKEIGSDVKENRVRIENIERGLKDSYRGRRL